MRLNNAATVADLLRMPEDGRKYELVDGEIHVTPSGMRHSEIALQIAYLLKCFLEQSPVGKVYTTDVGIQLPDGNVRSPDVCFVRTEKLPGGESPETFGELVPDLVVEVLSPTDNPRLVADKIGEYIQCGVPPVWLVDPKQKTVTVFRSLTDARQLTSTETITGEPILPGFTCKIARFF
jgi:Uma2 family endonuclease